MPFASSPLLRRATVACAAVAATAPLLLTGAHHGSAAVRPAVQPAVKPAAAANDVDAVTVLSPVGGPFSARSVWKTDISKAPVAANSAVLVNSIANQVKTYYGVAAFNVHRYNASFYTVPQSQPKVRVKFHDCQNKRYTPAGLYGPNGQFEDVPIPPDAIPAYGTDAALTIYQPSTDTYWDFWRAEQDADLGVVMGDGAFR